MIAILHFGAAVAPLSSHATELGSTVIPIPEDIFREDAPNSDLVKEAIEMLRLNNKYTLNKWYYEIKDFDNNVEHLSDFGGPDDHVLDFGGAEEKHIRPVSHHIFALAGSLKLGIYSEEATGVSKKEATRKLMKLIHSSSYRHKSNNKVNRRAWGGQWQSALWAAQIAMGAWFVWEELTDEDKNMVAKLVEAETNRFNAADPPYYRNQRGDVVYKGDSKAEENSWNASLLNLAVIMMPDHPNHAVWERQNILYQLSAYCTPEDIESDQIIDGVKMKDVLKGSNVNSDGTVVNHGVVHPDYMSAIMFNVCNVWVNQMAGVEPLGSSLHNGNLTYAALTVNKYKGKSMYQSSNGKPSFELHYPEGASWGAQRQANFWLLDIMADQFDWADGQKIRPLDWAQVRSTEMLRMMHRDTTGQYYQAKSEDGFESREEWIGQHLMWGYIGFWLSDLNKGN
ncbi:MAG: hypothetical protein AAGI48_11210 [Verrucomicrobiota bacterium]